MKYTIRQKSVNACPVTQNSTGMAATNKTIPNTPTSSAAWCGRADSFVCVLRGFDVIYSGILSKKSSKYSVFAVKPLKYRTSSNVGGSVSGHVNPRSMIGTIFFPFSKAHSISCRSQSPSFLQRSSACGGRISKTSLQFFIFSYSSVLNFPDRKTSISWKTVYPFSVSRS